MEWFIEFSITEFKKNCNEISQIENSKKIRKIAILLSIWVSDFNVLILLIFIDFLECLLYFKRIIVTHESFK
jgi:hypothetical protein